MVSGLVEGLTEMPALCTVQLDAIENNSRHKYSWGAPEGMYRAHILCLSLILSNRE